MLDSISFSFLFKVRILLLLFDKSLKKFLQDFFFKYHEISYSFFFISPLTLLTFIFEGAYKFLNLERWTEKREVMRTFIKTKKKKKKFQPVKKNFEGSFFLLHFAKKKTA